MRFKFGTGGQNSRTIYDRRRPAGGQQEINESGTMDDIIRIPGG